MALDFLKEAANVVLVGPNGVGKSTLAQNIAHQALIQGHTVLFTTAGQLLGELGALDSDSALRRRLRHYARAATAGDRRGRLPLVLQSPRRSDVRTGLPPLQTPQHTDHHQPPVRRVARGVPQRRLCRLARSTGWCITPKSSPSRVNPTVSRRRASGPNSAPASAVVANHEHTPDAAGCRCSHPGRLDARAGARRVRTARRVARQALGRPRCIQEIQALLQQEQGFAAGGLQSNEPNRDDRSF